MLQYVLNGVASRSTNPKCSILGREGCTTQADFMKKSGRDELLLQNSGQGYNAQPDFQGYCMLRRREGTNLEDEKVHLVAAPTKVTFNNIGGDIEYHESITTGIEETHGCMIILPQPQ